MTNNSLRTKNSKAGFSLIETLVAVLLLATAIAGPLTIASKSLIAATVAKDQIIASYLAQDAVEYVRVIRDTNRLRGNNWLAGLDGTSNTLFPPDGTNSDCLGANGCYLDSTGNSVSSSYNIAYCNNNNCLTSSGATSGSGSVPIRYHTTNARYTYSASGSTATIFVRSVKIAEIVNEREALVTVSVFWTDTGNRVRSVTMQETIFNWQ